LEAVGFFQNMFMAQPNLAISDQLASFKNYPRMFTEEYSIRLTEPVTSTGILSTLKGFKASKILSPNGWTVDFFIAFDILRYDILEMVEEIRRKGRVYGALNINFI
jgi:hypothetical protein